MPVATALRIRAFWVYRDPRYPEVVRLHQLGDAACLWCVLDAVPFGRRRDGGGVFGSDACDCNGLVMEC